MAPPILPGDQGVSGLLPPRDFQRIPVGPRRTRIGRYRALNLAGDVPVVETFNEHAYAWLRGEFQKPVPNGGSDLALPSTGAPRNMLLLRNSTPAAADPADNVQVFVSFGTNASLSSILRLTPGTQVMFDTVVPQDDVHVFADGPDATIVIAFSNTAGVLT